MPQRRGLADFPPHVQKQIAAQLYAGQEKRQIVPMKQGKRIRQDSSPLLNKLEEEFKETMTPSWMAGRCHIKEQAIRLRLGNGIWYKPDFVEFAPDWTPPPFHMRVTAYEIKGPHVFRGGMENLKVAATTFPEWVFKLCWLDPDCGEWIMQTVLP